MFSDPGKTRGPVASLNSLYFHRGWENQPNSRGLYIHYKDSLLKVGGPSHPQYRES